MKWIVLAGAMIATTVAMAGGAPARIVYQGRLLKGDVVVQANAQPMTFALYRSPDGGTPVWSETFGAVPVQQGYYSVTLPSSPDGFDSAVFDGNPLFLEISVGTNKLTPRQQILSVPYAVAAANGVPPGAVMPFAGGKVPDGWLLCDGREVSAAKYPQLAEALGSTWGASSDGGTVVLPDLRGRFTLGQSSAYPLASEGGAEQHSHDMTHVHPLPPTTGGIDGQANINCTGQGNYDCGGHRHLLGGNTGNASDARTGTQSTMPPYAAMNHIIKF